MASEIGRITGILEVRDEATEVVDQFAKSADISISGLSGLVTRFGQNLGSIGGIVRELGGPFQGLGDIIGGFAAGGPAGAGITMIGQGVDFLKGSVEAAKESERVMTALRTAVENQGTSWGTVKDKIEEALGSMQATSRFSDEELAKALKTLVQHGMDLEEAMKALPTAMDTAVGSGKPLSEVASAIAKAFEGQDSALTRLVPAISDLKDKMGDGADNADLFQGALSTLNERFGGSAQEDAKTYAGIQERMANAWNQFQEDVGNKILPILTDLMNGLMKISDEGIKPLMDAFGELWKALFGEDVDLKGFGDFLQNVIIFNLKGLTAFIKEDVVPTVRAIHEAFEKAAQVIGPPLKTISDAVSGFIKTLTDAFQGFYDWLVGRSLWMDMWNGLLSVAGEIIRKLLGDLGTKLFEPMKGAFTSAMAAVETAWDTGWQTVQTAFRTFSEETKGAITGFLESAKTTLSTGVDTIKTNWETGWNAVQTDLNTKFDDMKTKIETSTGEYAPTMTAALGAVQSAMNAGMDLVKGDWQGALDHTKAALDNWGTAAKGAMDLIMGQLKGAVDAGLGLIKGAWDGLVAGLQQGIGAVQTAFGQVLGAVQGVGSGIQSATQSATSTVTNLFQQAFNTVATAASDFWNWLVGGSLWPEMLDQMKRITEIALSMVHDIFVIIFNAIEGAASSTFESIASSAASGLASMVSSAQAALGQVTAIRSQMATAMAAPIRAAAIPSVGAGWTPAAPMNMSLAEMEAYGQKLAEGIFAGTFGRPSAAGPYTGSLANITLPVSVQVDGVTVSRVVEQRMISQRQLAGGY